MTDEESRRIILSRRARFVAAALASASLAASACDAEPQVCLSPPVPADAGDTDSGEIQSDGSSQRG
jgi:hypothetical protein